MSRVSRFVVSPFLSLIQITRLRSSFADPFALRHALCAYSYILSVASLCLCPIRRCPPSTLSAYHLAPLRHFVLSALYLWAMIARPANSKLTPLAVEFERYLVYVRQLRFDQQPDYNFLRQLYRDLFVRSGFTLDYIYDWNVIGCAAGLVCVDCRNEQS